MEATLTPAALEEIARAIDERITFHTDIHPQVWREMSNVSNALRNALERKQPTDEDLLA
jgi:hypothetical protein